MSPQNPLTRLEQVARELGELAGNLHGFLGAEAEQALAKWQAEIRAAIDQIEERGEDTGA